MKNHSNPPPDPAFALLFVAVLCSAILGGWYAENPTVWPHGLLCWFGDHFDALSFFSASPGKRAMVIFAVAAFGFGLPAVVAGDALGKAQRRAKARRAAREAMEADQERAEMQRIARARQGTPALVEAIRARPDRVPPLRLEVLTICVWALVPAVIFYAAAARY